MKYALMFLLALLPGILAAQTITDTLWSVPELDGPIAFRPVSGIFNMSTSSFNFISGDGWDFFMGEEVFSRSFLSFDLRNLSHSDTSLVRGATIGIYQFEATGNSQDGVYPIWDVAGGDTHFCVLDHIDYGSSLDLGDFTAGDPGDPQTLKTNIGIISDSADVGYKTMDVTPYVKQDIGSGRVYTQYRLRFTIDLDYDSLGDQLLFGSGDYNSIRPWLEVHFDSVTAIRDQSMAPQGFKLFQNYPNPFNSVTRIGYSLRHSGQVRLDVFDVSGRLVSILASSHKPPGEYELVFDAAGLPSGVYYYRMKMGRQAITKKMLLIR